MVLGLSREPIQDGHCDYDRKTTRPWRHLTTGQRAYLAYQYQQLLTVGRGTRTDVQGLSTNLSKVDSRESAAKKAGVSEGSLGGLSSSLALAYDVSKSVPSAAFIRNVSSFSSIPTSITLSVFRENHERPS